MSYLWVSLSGDAYAAADAYAPYSLDLSPTGFHFFKFLDHFLSEQCFATQGEVENGIKEFIDSMGPAFCTLGIENLAKLFSLLPTALLENYDKRVNPFYITNKTVLVKFSVPSITLEQVVNQENQATFLYGLNVVRFGEQTGDPVTIGLTSMLALSITLSVVADNVPKAATVPLIGWFVVVCLTLCILSVFFGVILDKYRSTSKQKNNEMIKKVSIFLLCLFQLSLLINVIVFFSFSWNHDQYSLIDLFLDKYDVTG
ncbi:unnamed protein product, partial [Mesorhabditis belari]|uniref:Neurotransmitter-gated ion-channel transmembrane domain-containing protein n=1 Tax=Mesorhabditis belari TaxID=2138241 RepID=A0AAF3EEE1_9BILA